VFSSNIDSLSLASLQVQKFTSDCQFITSWSSLGSGSTSFQFNGFGIGIDLPNNVYVADSYSDRIQKFTNTGTLITEFGSSGSANGQFNFPQDVAIDSSNNLYITDYHRVQIFAPASNNHPPVADSQNIIMKKNKPVDIVLRATDTDATDTLTFSIVSGPLHGVLTNLHSSSTTTAIVTYTPDKKFTGDDSFTFKANDGKANSNIATVSIKVDNPQPKTTTTLSPSANTINQEESREPPEHCDIDAFSSYVSTRRRKSL
jgi:Big-like domain-containing protein/NHL repeat-containing protein